MLPPSPASTPSRATQYERRAVAVGVEAGTLLAEAYVVRAAESALMTDARWDSARFAATHPRPYVDRCRRLRVARAVSADLSNAWAP